MKRNLLLIILLAFYSQSCSLIKEPDLLSKFSGTWVLAEKLNDGTYKGDAQTILTVKKTSETTASVDYLYKFTGLYTSNNYDSNFKAEANMGIFTKEDDALVASNLLMNVSNSLVFQRNGTPVTSNYMMANQFAKVRMSLDNNKTLKVVYTYGGGTTNFKTYQKQ